MDEVWVKAAGFPGYEVSSLGRVRSINRFDAQGRCIAGRILTNARKPKATKDRGSYWRVRLSINRKVFDCAVHTLVLKSFIGPRPYGMHGCHNDGNVDNNAIENLRWDTSKANQLDKIKHGTIARGERNGFAKLTNSDVTHIKISSLGPTALSRQFGVSRIQIQRIRRGDCWGHLAVTVAESEQGNTKEDEHA